MVQLRLVPDRQIDGQTENTALANAGMYISRDMHL